MFVVCDEIFGCAGDDAVIDMSSWHGDIVSVVCVEDAWIGVADMEAFISKGTDEHIIPFVSGLFETIKRFE